MHIGEVVEGLMGFSSTRSYDILDDTVNTASRLCGAARPSEVLLSEFIAHRLNMDDLGRFHRAIQMKGKEHSIMAYSL